MTLPDEKLLAVELERTRKLTELEQTIYSYLS